MSFPRYHQYKASGVPWLGQVPEDWEVEPLKYNSYVKGRIGWQNLRSEEFTSEGPFLITGMHFKDGSVDWEQCYHITEERYAVAPEIQIHADDVLITKDGSIGKLAHIRELPGKASLNSHLLVVRPLRGRYTPRFLFLLLSSFAFRTHIEIHQSGVTFFGITQEAVVQFPVILPPFPEQQAIVGFLDRETAKIDELVAEQRRLMELLKEKRQAVISHAVTKGLNPKVPMKPSGIEWLGNVPAHWEVKRVKSVSNFTTSGPRGWSVRVGEEGQLFVQSGDLNDSLQVEFGTVKRVLVQDDAEASRTRLRDGDVVVCVTGAKTGNVAVCTSVPEPAYVNQHLCLIRPSQEISPVFLGVLLKSKVGQSYFELSQYGLKQGLSLEDVREAPVILPPHAEQISVIAYLETETAKLDTLTAEAERAIALLQERRTALISAAVTGQIDVRNLSQLDPITNHSV